MSKPKLSIETANVIAAAIIQRALQGDQNVNTFSSALDIEAFVEISVASPKKRGRPAKMKTQEELGVEADADEYALDFTPNWSEKARQNSWSDDM